MHEHDGTLRGFVARVPLCIDALPASCARALLFMSFFPSSRGGWLRDIRLHRKLAQSHSLLMKGRMGRVGRRRYQDAADLDPGLLCGGVVVVTGEGRGGVGGEVRVLIWGTKVVHSGRIGFDFFPSLMLHWSDTIAISRIEERDCLYNT